MSSSSDKKTKRTFTVTDSSIGFSGGSYKPNKTGHPLSAAHRAARVLFRMARNEKQNPKWKKFETSAVLLKFTIRETTRGSDKQEYQYEAKIKQLRGDDVKVVKRGDVEYTIRTEIVCRAARYTPIKGGEDDDN